MSKSFAIPSTQLHVTMSSHHEDQFYRSSGSETSVNASVSQEASSAGHPPADEGPLAENADFIALPVGDGDAFLLRRGDDVLLIDSGGRSKSFLETLSDEIVSDTPALDAVVCTHNDLDHTGGLLKLLEEGHVGQEVDINQIWLPLHWSENLIDIAFDPEDFVYRLFEELEESGYLKSSDPADLPTLREFGARYREREKRRQWSEGIEDLFKEIAQRDSESDVRLSQRSSRSGDEPPKIFEQLPPGLYRDSYSQRRYERSDQVPDQISEYFDDPRLVLRDATDFLGIGVGENHAGIQTLQNTYPRLFEIIHLARNIRSITLLAYKHDIELCWFENTTDDPGHSPRSDLKPLNAEYIDGRLPYHFIGQSPFQYLGRTSTNEHALVFHARSPAASDANWGPGSILFSSDSDFSFAHEVDAPWDYCMLVTAPHHGSDTNAPAYIPILHNVPFTCLPNRVFVRSGRRESSWPGDAYLHLKNTKVCTQCRDGSDNSQTVYLRFTGSKWSLVPGTRRCFCEPGADWPPSN